VVVVCVFFTIGVKVTVWVEAVEMDIVSENVMVPTEMVVSHSVVVSSNITVEILGVCLILVNFARLEMSSGFRELSSTVEVKFLAEVVSLSDILT
jgi:hypothetical protein